MIREISDSTTLYSNAHEWYDSPAMQTADSHRLEPHNPGLLLRPRRSDYQPVEAARIVRLDRSLTISGPKEAEVSIFLSVFLQAIQRWRMLGGIRNTDHGTLLRP